MGQTPGQIPDVRVKLSAEGQVEIINAFRKVQAEAEAANSGAAAAGKATEASTRDAATAVAQLARRFGIDLPNSLTKYISKLGGVEKAAGLAFKASVVAAVVAAVIAGLPKLAEWIDHLRGINKEMFELEEAAKRLNKELDPTASIERSRALLLGRQREVEVLERQARERSLLGRATERLTGLVFETTEQKNLKEARRLRDEASDSIKRMEAAGRRAGDTQKTALEQEVELLGKTEAQRIQILALRERDAIAAKFAAGEISSARQEELLALSRQKESLQLKVAAAKLDKEGARNAERVAKATREFLEASLKTQEAEIQRELAVLRARNKLSGDEDQRRFEEGLLGLERFYDDRRARIDTEGAAELAILAQQAERLKTLLGEAEKLPEGTQLQRLEKGRAILELEERIAQVEAQTETSRLDTAGKRAANEAERAAEIRKADQDALAAEVSLAEAQGRRHEAERLALAAQIAALQRLKGESDESFRARQDVLREAGERRIQLGELELRLQQEFDRLADERLATETLVNAGIISQSEGQEQVAAAELRRLPVLREIVALMRAAAVTPEELARIAELDRSLQKMQSTADLSGQRLRDFRAEIEQAVQSGLVDFLSRGILEAENLGDAFRQLGLNIVQSIQRAIAEMLAMLIVTKLLRGVLGLPFGGGGGVTAAAGAGGLPGFQHGGLAFGPAGPDRIPAWLTLGEFIVRRPVVAQPGVMEALRELNDSGRLRLLTAARIIEPDDLRAESITRIHMLDGGPVGEPGPGGSGGAGGRGGDATVRVQLDKGLVADLITNDSDTQRALFRFEENNRGRLRAIRGG